MTVDANDLVSTEGYDVDGKREQKLHGDGGDGTFLEVTGFTETRSSSFQCPPVFVFFVFLSTMTNYPQHDLCTLASSRHGPVERTEVDGSQEEPPPSCLSVCMERKLI